MTSASMADLLKEAEAQGLATWTPESGPYTLTVARGNKGTTKGGALKFGFQLKVVGGPNDGKSYWDNVNFSGKAVPIAIRTLGTFGVSGEFLSTLTGPLEDGADKVIAEAVGTTFSCDLTVKADGDFTNFSYKNVKHDGPATTSEPDRPPAASAEPVALDDDEPF